MSEAKLDIRFCGRCGLKFDAHNFNHNAKLCHPCVDIVTKAFDVPHVSAGLAFNCFANRHRYALDTNERMDTRCLILASGGEIFDPTEKELEKAKEIREKIPEFARRPLATNESKRPEGQEPDHKRAQANDL